MPTFVTLENKCHLSSTLENQYVLTELRKVFILLVVQSGDGGLGFEGKRTSSKSEEQTKEKKECSMRAFVRNEMKKTLFK